MQTMNPIEMKYHMKDIERSFAACRSPADAKDGRQTAGHGWMAKLVKWMRRPSAVAMIHMVD